MTIVYLKSGVELKVGRSAEEIKAALIDASEDDSEMAWINLDASGRSFARYGEIACVLGESDPS